MIVEFHMIKMSVPASFAYSKDLSQTVRRTLALTNRGICKRFGIKVVPIVGEGTLEEAIELTRIGMPSHISEVPQLMEGIVATPKVELLQRNGARIITKIKHKDFKK